MSTLIQTSNDAASTIVGKGMAFSTLILARVYPYRLSSTETFNCRVTHKAAVDSYCRRTDLYIPVTKQLVLKQVTTQRKRR